MTIGLIIDGHKIILSKTCWACNGKGENKHCEFCNGTGEQVTKNGDNLINFIETFITIENNKPEIRRKRHPHD